ncbi:hypothetical protein COK56_29665 [Bacillus cereus]|nr:hypothetical protein COK56_29665 [Bacillus cereus]
MKQKTEQDKSKELTIQVNADTTGVLKGIKEVTEAANECVEALSKLETVLNKLTNKNNSIEIEVPVLLNGKQIAEGITQIRETEKEIAVRTC